jgi:antitoxin VapB
MGINVKNARVEAEVRLLAEKLGVGLTEAIEAGVTAKLGLLQAEKDADIARRVAVIAEIQARVAQYVPEGATSDHRDLYDDDGLPM